MNDSFISLILRIAIYDNEEKKRHAGYETPGHSHLVEIDHRGNNPWTQLSVAKALMMSQAEVSESLARSSCARLLYENGKR